MVLASVDIAHYEYHYLSSGARAEPENRPLRYDGTLEVKISIF